MEIKNLTVLGAGVLGAQIAFMAAYSGINVTSYDINDDAVAAGKKRFDAIGGQMIKELSSATEVTVAAARSHLSQTSDLAEAVGAADVIIEAVPERLDLKRDVWAKVGELAPKHTIFATNTSTLLPSDIADASGAPERFLAMHFANHIWVNNTAEIMPHAGTDPKYVEALVQFAEQFNMVPVPLKREKAGYVLNTLLVPFLNAGMELAQLDIADIADIDRDWRNSTGSPMGPFQIIDEVGLRTVAAILQSEQDAPEWKKQFLAETIVPMIEAGKTGREAGEGFYTYDADGNPGAV